MGPHVGSLGLRPRGREGLSLSAAHVAELCGEIAPLVRGAEVKEVLGLPPRDLVLVLAPSDARRLLRLRFSADPEAARLHLQHRRVERHEGPLGPFFRAVGTDLVGGTVAELAPVRSDRIAILEVRGGGAGERRALVLELFGRRANLVLLGPGDRVVAVLVEPPVSSGSGKPGSAATGKPRIEIGAIWHPPAGKPAEPGPPISEAFGRGEAADFAPLSRIVETALGSRADEVRRERDARDLAERLERKLERARGLVRGLEARLAAGSEAERVRADGELLKANFGRVARGAKRVEVEDPAQDGAPRTIVLDPRLTPAQNLERLFDRARKLERDAASAAADLESARSRERDLAALAAEARAPASDPASLEARALGEGLLEERQSASPRRKPEPAPRLPYKAFESSRGGEIRVGRNARDNDELTFRHAKGSDLWLHTADAPGSHVVLVLAKGADPESEEMIDAAHLAVHFSPLRGASRARVHVARRKEVHKPRGAKPGLVQLSGGRILDVRMQPERLRRLLGSRGPSPGESAPAAGG